MVNVRGVSNRHSPFFISEKIGLSRDIKCDENILADHYFFLSFHDSSTDGYRGSGVCNRPDLSCKSNPKMRKTVRFSDFNIGLI